MKLTRRKSFNFFRSYYDVFNELNDKDKLEFIKALLDRQFLSKEPEGLKGMAKFAYISQTNSIDSQVKGYNDRQRSLDRPLLGEEDTPPQPPPHGVQNTPPQQEKEKEKEKGQDTIDFERVFQFWNSRTKKMPNIKSIQHDRKKALKSRLKEYDLESVLNALELACQSAFLNGKNDRSFTASFDWVIRPNNFPKVLEGNYTDKPKKQVSRGLLHGQ